MTPAPARARPPTPDTVAARKMAAAVDPHAAALHALNVIHGFSLTALRIRPACSCASITGPIGL